MIRSNFSASVLILFTVSAALLSAQTNTFPSSGNVGVGTTSPSTTLHVVGTNLFASAGAGTETIKITGNDQSNTRIRFQNGSASWALVQGITGVSNTSFSIYDYAANATRVTVAETTGNVGIGTTVPGEKFEVIGRIKASQEVFSTGVGATRVGMLNAAGAAYPDTYFGMHYDAANNVGVIQALSGGVAWRGLSLVPNGGNVGIGTTNPTAPLTVQSNAGQVTLATASGPATYYTTLASRYDSAHPFAINVANNSTGATEFFGVYADGGGANNRVVFPAGNVGIGTTSPNASLDIWKAYSAGTDSLRFSYNDGSAYWMGIQPYVVGAGNVGYKFRTTNGGSTLDVLAITGSGNVGIGTTNPTQKLAVNGTIRAKEVIVDTGWSDYVFKPDYHLASLSEVEGAIQKDGHLPGVPSASEVAEHGVSVGAMQATLLAKLEEVTLHLIRMEKENAELRARVRSLEVAR